MISKAQMRGTPESPTPQAPPSIEPETQAEIEENEASDKLPEQVTVEDDGTWLFTLKHPLEPTAGDPDGKDVEKLRIPANLYARNIREASRKSESQVDVVFYLASSMTGVPAKILDRVDARDYAVLSNLIRRRTNHLPE